jgi:hypothetical protein
MEPVITTICGLIAAGWVVWKTGQAVRTLREQRRSADGPRSGSGNGRSASIGTFGGGSTSGDGYGSHGPGDCGGHGHGGDGHGGGDCGGGHGGW